MKIEKLNQAVAIAKKTGQAFIATADAVGAPHIACAGKINVEAGDHLAVTEWFCPGTVANLQENKNISIAVWDKHTDTGLQVLGRVESIQDMAILDGYSPAVEKQSRFIGMPQVERKLLIKVEKILDFKLGPHSDIEE
jgi:hypothetical protein